MSKNREVLVRKIEDVPVGKVDRADDATIQVLLGPEDGMPNYYTRLFTVQPGGRIPRHRHATIEHQQVVLAGELVLINDEGEEMIVREGDVVYLPAQKYHGYENRSDCPVKFICIVPATTDYETEWLDK